LSSLPRARSKGRGCSFPSPNVYFIWGGCP
jgi:hypothetical protein